MRSLAIIFAGSIFFASLHSRAELTMPKQLDQDERRSVLRVLGFGSRMKILSSPVPLGGHQGFEFGVSTEYIPIGDLAGVGDRPDVRGEHSTLNLTFGKGLHHNFDILFSFTPLPQTENVVSYGAQLRWGFHEFKRFPAILSLIWHGSGTNFANLLNTRTTGADLVMCVVMDDAALYFGGGPIRSIGSFVGGDQGMTIEKTTIDEDLSGIHTVFGFSLNFEKVSLTLEVDRVVQSAYGARIGYRF